MSAPSTAGLTTPLAELLGRLPEAAKDLRVNLQNLLSGDGPLTPEQRWGTAIACAIASRSPELARALAAEVPGERRDAVTDDARAAAALMGMTNIYYRFRHLVGKPGYASKPPRLRMQRLAKPATSAADLELYSLAVSAVTGCEQCVRAHEEQVGKAGLTEDQVHDAVRIAAVVHGVAAGLGSP